MISAGLYQTHAYTPPAFVFAPDAIASCAFIAMFAFLGFEALVNMAEETHDPRKTLPRAILLSLGIATALYVIVAYVAVNVAPLDVLSNSPTPLLDVVIGNAVLFGIIALTATANGVLIEILMVSRMMYGMADHGWLPHQLAHVWPRTHALVHTILITGVILLALVVPFDVGELARRRQRCAAQRLHCDQSGVDAAASQGAAPGPFDPRPALDTAAWRYWGGGAVSGAVFLDATGCLAVREGHQAAPGRWCGRFRISHRPHLLRRLLYAR